MERWQRTVAEELEVHLLRGEQDDVELDDREEESREEPFVLQSFLVACVRRSWFRITRRMKHTELGFHRCGGPWCQQPA